MVEIFKNYDILHILRGFGNNGFYGQAAIASKCSLEVPLRSWDYPIASTVAKFMVDELLT